jgi:hypothetical protein
VSLEAVDVSLAWARFLLVVMPDPVDRIEIDSIIAQGAQDGSLGSWPGSRTSVATWEVARKSAWEQPEELELAGLETGGNR